MTAEQLEAIAGGANPASVGMDCEEAITYLARRVLAAEKLVDAAQGMNRIVEEIYGAMNHGTWRDENGLRLKDTAEWVALYNALTAYREARK